MRCFTVVDDSISKGIAVGRDVFGYRCINLGAKKDICSYHVWGMPRHAQMMFEAKMEGERIISMPEQKETAGDSILLLWKVTCPRDWDVQFEIESWLAVKSTKTSKYPWFNPRTHVNGRMAEYLILLKEGDTVAAVKRHVERETPEALSVRLQGGKICVEGPFGKFKVAPQRVLTAEDKLLRAIFGQKKEPAFGVPFQTGLQMA